MTDGLTMCSALATTDPPMAGELHTSEEQERLHRARGGDADAFCQLCHGYETRLYRQALILCRDEHMAQDLAQETLVEAWRSLHRFKGHCRFYTWLCAILLNRHRNLRRGSWWSWIAQSPEAASRASTSEQVDASVLWPDQHSDQRDRAALLWACVEALPARHREVIHLRFYVDDSIEGIATALNCSVGTVKSRLFHALEKLRKMKGLAEKTCRNPDR